MSVDEALIIGSDTHQYEWIDQWGDLPEGKKFGTTHGVVEDSQGRIFIHHTGEESIYIFDKAGAFLGSWGSDYSDGAHGLFYNQEADGEYLYLAATGLGIVVKCDLDGKELLRIDTPDLPGIYNANKKFVPTEVAVASTGTIYIADGYGQPWVHAYDQQGAYIKSFGGPGSDDGQLANVHGINIDTRTDQELVVVADRGNSRLQYFSLDGDYVKKMDHDLRRPCTVVQHKDEIYIPDLQSRLSVFDKDDTLITHLGDREGAWEIEGWPNLPKSNWLPGQFSSPHDMHVSDNGDIWVAEWLSEGTGKVTKLIRKT